MSVVLRNTFSVFAGVVVGSLVNMALVMVGPRVIPPPAGVDMAKAESIAAGMHLFEPKHFLFPFLAHALGTFVGALVAYLVAATYRPLFAWAIGVLFLGGGIAAAFMIPAPKWFIALDVVGAYLPMAWLATKVMGRKASAAEATR